MNTLITGKVKFYSQTQNKAFIDLLRKYPAYTTEEEVAAFERLKAGDIKAKDDIILHNQRWVYSLAKEYARDEIEVMDYVSEGNFGLIEAIDKYELDKGYKFITFAVWYIRQKMNLYLMTERDTIKKSNNAKLCKKLEKVKNDFFVQNGYQPTFDEIKTMLYDNYGIEVKNDSDLYDLEINSINENVGEDSTFEETDTFTRCTATNNCEDESEDNDLQDVIEPLLECLPKENQDFIKKLYHIGYGAEYTPERICEEYNLDEDGLKKMENRILKYLRQEIQKYREAV